MERNRDSKIAISSEGNGLSRRRRRISNAKDSAGSEEMREMERFWDRERFQKKNRECSKRRKCVMLQRSGGDICRDNDASDEEERNYYVHYEMNQPSPQSPSLSSHRRSLRTLRSAPILGTSVDETIGVPIPRRARSTTIKRLHDYGNSSSGRLDEELSCRRISLSPANENFSCASVFSPKSLCASTKKNNRYAEPKTRDLKSSSDYNFSSVIQDDIEIEVVEALFDLMKQSQSISQNSKNSWEEELKNGGKYVGKALVDTEAITNESVEALKKEGEYEFLSEEKVVSPRERKSLSRARVDALQIQNPIVTKADNAAGAIPTQEDTKLEIDFMKNETISRDVPLATANQQQEQKIATICSNQWTNLDLEKFSQNMSSVGTEGKQQERRQRDQKEQINQSQTSLLPFPISMGGWPNVLPQRGYMTPFPFRPIDGNVRLTTAVQAPEFKLSESKQKKSATHLYIAQNIYIHQQLIVKSLWSESTGAGAGAGTLYGPMSLLPNSLQPMQRLIPGNTLVGFYHGQGEHNLATTSSRNGKDITSEVFAATKAKKNEDITLHTPASNFLHGPAFTIPLNTAGMAPGILQGAFQSASASASTSSSTNSSRRSSVNLSLPPEVDAMRDSYPKFRFNDVGLCMGIGEKNGLQALNITTPQSKSAAQSPPVPVPIFNSSFYSSTSFNVSQGQNMPMHVPIQPGTKVSCQNSPIMESPLLLSSKMLEADISKKGSASFAQALAPHSVTLNNGLSTPSFPIQPMNIRTLQAGAVTGVTGNSDSGKNQTHGVQSSIFSIRGGTDISSNFMMGSSPVDDLTQSLCFVPAASTNQQPCFISTILQKSGFPGMVPNLPQCQKQCSIQMQQTRSDKMKASNHCSRTLLSGMFPNKQVSDEPDKSSYSPNIQSCPKSKSTKRSSRSPNLNVASIPQKYDTHSSVVDCSVSAASFQEQNTVTNDHSVTIRLPLESHISKNTSGSQITPSTIGNVDSTVSGQSSDASANGPSQKSSPACGRNMLSLLSTCPSQISGLKY